MSVTTFGTFGTRLRFPDTVYKSTLADRTDLFYELRFIDQPRSRTFHERSGSHLYKQHVYMQIMDHRGGRPMQVGRGLIVNFRSGGRDIGQCVFAFQMKPFDSAHRPRMVDGFCHSATSWRSDVVVFTEWLLLRRCNLSNIWPG